MTGFSRKAVLTTATLLIALGAAAEVVEVNLKLPMRPKLKLEGGEQVAIAPFILAGSAEDDRGNREARVDLQAEFQRFLSKQFAKETKSSVILLSDVRLPGADMKALESDPGFWRDISRRTGADLIVSGVIDFDIEDKVGYRTEEFISPVDGRTYYRQVLIETTGFVFDIVLAVFDGETGEKLVEENFRDFKEFAQRDYDEILGLFENLRSLETQLLSIFVAQERSATRFLFTE